MPDLEPIIHRAPAGSSLYAVLDDGDDTAVDLSAGTGRQTTRYACTASQLIAAKNAASGGSTGLPAGEYSYTVCVGTAAASDASDDIVGADELVWDGTDAVRTLDLVSAVQSSITFVPDPARTFVVRRDTASRLMEKRIDEAPEFYVDWSKMLGSGEFISSVGTFSANVGTSGLTVTATTKESGTVNGITLSGGSAGQQVIDVEVSTDQGSTLEAQLRFNITASIA